jgi:23S rRNA (uridine2552-2'-O)-methyltransferase
VVGLDRRELPAPVPGARALVGDVYTITDEELLGGLRAFDLVLSDMAPDTTGIRGTDQARSAALVEQALGIAERLLAPGGSFVAKIFQGPDVAAIRKRMAAHFSEVHLYKPEASRAASTELYLVGKGFAPK